MPLIVTTPVTDAPPSKVVSQDGKLTALADTTNGGVLLRADFTPQWTVQDTFEANISGWSANYGCTISRTTTAPITGSGSFLVTRSDPQSAVAARVLPAWTPVANDMKVTVWFNAKLTSAGIGVNLNAYWGSAGASFAGIATTTTPRPYFATFYVNANTNPGTTLFLEAETTDDSGGMGGGNLVVDDFGVYIQPPTDVYILRDGIPIRGAAPSSAAGGVAYGYDYEATFGAATTWTAQPVYTIRGKEVLAQEGSSVSLVVPDLKDDYNLSLKSINQPDLSRKVIGKWPAATRSWDGRDSMAANPGASLSSGSWDVPVQAAETWVMETVTHDEADALERLLTSGPMLVQHQYRRHRPDAYMLVKSIACDYKIGPNFPQRIWTVGLLPIMQPTTVGAPLLVPGKSYGDLDDLGTYANLASTLGIYDAWLSPISVVVGTPYGTTNYGTTAWGV